MNAVLKPFRILASAALLASFLPAFAQAQTTDAYHAIQVFPVVVDSASFTQKFTFRNPNTTNALVISSQYFPGTGTTQPGAIACPDIVVPISGEAVVASLRDFCPGLAAGSQFGYLYTFENGGYARPYAAFSRVSNGAGNGFSVEAFAAHTFTSADSTVIGLRRLAAGGGRPAFQSNCFIGNLNEVTAPVTPVTTTVTATVYSSAGVALGNAAIDLVPGRLTRLLDIFAAAGVPAGDYDNATVRFVESGVGEPGLMSFCTVQDNSSFGADFRIAKQEFGDTLADVGAKDGNVRRNSTVSADVATSDGPGRPFEILAGALGINVHVMYFRHPDWIQCEIINPGTGVRALNSYGLEMRLVDPDGVTALAGGNGITGFGALFLGDKTERNFGANTRYTIEVESNGNNTGAVRAYSLHCQSGSGHTAADLIRYNDQTLRF
ncbi:MAG: hypothetical protein NT117_07460 [Gammaproteobacteria bacterium]|nr:hypothetical protein [Gammaproteobacteria bacterium]